MRIIHAATLLLLAAAVVVFCVQNLETVSVRFLGWGVGLPFPILVVLVYVLGMITGGSLLSFVRRSLRKATQSQA